jgi:hypothetical protein
MTLPRVALRVGVIATIFSVAVSAAMIIKPLPVARMDDADPSSGIGWDYCVGPAYLKSPSQRSGAMSGCSVAFNGTAGLSTSTSCRGEYDYTCPEGTYICVYNFGPNSSMCGGGSGPGDILQ